MMNQVMIVDDDPHVRETVTQVLQRHGYQVVAAPDGPACLERLRQGFQGVVLMDVMMPGLDGWQTIRAMAQEELARNSLVCMLTGLASPGTNGEGLEQHVFDYLPKPFSVNDLAALVRHAASYL